MDRRVDETLFWNSWPFHATVRYTNGNLVCIGMRRHLTTIEIDNLDELDKLLRLLIEVKERLEGGTDD